MSTRPRRGGMFTSPVLVGAAAILVAIVAVVLAFQANNGLPFVPRYTLYVRVHNAEELTRNSEVHEGGNLIGVVSSIQATRTRAGTPIALLKLSLEKSVEPLPVDSRFVIRLKASIGLKYLDLQRGGSRRTWRNGATVPVSDTGADVDLDQFLSMFTPPTRAGIASSTVGFSDALAGRGPAINDAIGAFLPLVSDLRPVMQNLSSRRTDLAGFFRGLGAFSAALAPVADQQASLYANLDTTFRALASVARPSLQNWISQTPPTFTTVISDGPREAAFAADTARLFADLRPGIATLRKSAPVLADAFRAGVSSLPGTAALDRRTVQMARVLADYSANRTAEAGLERIRLTASSLISPLAFLTPVQATCNYVTLFLRNTASALSEQVRTGTALRFNLVTIDDVLGGEAVPSSKPYLTPDNASDEHGPLHSDPYPNTDSPGEIAECSAGNESYSGASALIGNPPGDVGVHTEKTKRSGP